MSVRIRKLQQQDWPRVAEIYQKGLDTGIASFETSAPTWPSWDASHLEVGRLVIEQDNQVLGWASLSAVSHRHVYRGVAEVSIYIDPRHAGEGLASALMKHLIQESEAQGFWTLQSGIFRQNISSIKLHEKMGFRMIGFRERVGKRNGVWYDNVLMERRSPIVGLDES